MRSLDTSATLLDQFAIAALPVILDDKHAVWQGMADVHGEDRLKMIANIAYGIAEVMMEARMDYIWPEGQERPRYSV